MDELNELAEKTRIRASALFPRNNEYVAGAVKYAVLTRAAELGVSVFCKYYRREGAFDVILKSDQKYVARFYDRHEGRWFDTYTGTKEEADVVASKCNAKVKDNSGYYQVFMADTKMLHS